jgi:hypothetical protein
VYVSGWMCIHDTNQMCVRSLLFLFNTVSPLTIDIMSSSSSRPKLLAYANGHALLHYPSTSLLHRRWVPEANVYGYTHHALERMKLSLPSTDPITHEPKVEAWLQEEVFLSVPPSHPNYAFHTFFQSQETCDPSTLIARPAVLVKWVGQSATASTWEWRDDPRILVAPRTPVSYTLSTEEARLIQGIHAQWNQGKVAVLSYPEEKYIHPLWMATLPPVPILILTTPSSFWTWVDAFESFTSLSVCIYEDEKGEAGRRILRESMYWSHADVLVLTTDRLRKDFSKCTDLDRFRTILVDQVNGVHGANIEKTMSIWLQHGKRIGCMHPLDTISTHTSLLQRIFNCTPSDYICYPREGMTSLESKWNTHRADFYTGLERIIQERESLRPRVLEDAESFYHALMEFDRAHGARIPDTLLDRVFYLFERRLKKRIAVETKKAEAPIPIVHVEPAPQAKSSTTHPPVESRPRIQLGPKRLPPPSRSVAPPSFVSEPKRPMPSFKDYLKQEGLAGKTTLSRDGKDWYAMLGVVSTASALEIKQAYYRANLRYHPDKNKGVTMPIFYDVQDAFRVLKDPALRNVYDRNKE